MYNYYEWAHCHAIAPLLYMLELLYIDILPCLDASLVHWSTNLLLKHEPGIQTWNREFKLWFLVFEFPGNQKPRIKFGTGNSHFYYLLLNSREVWIIGVHPIWILGVWFVSGSSQGAPHPGVWILGVWIPWNSNTKNSNSRFQVWIC